VGSRATARNPRKQGDLAWFPPLFTSPLAVRIPVIRKSRKRRKTVGFNFSFLFRSALGPLFFRSISSADPFFSFFVSPSSLFQVVGGMSKGGRRLSFCRVCAADGG
jgi:hypothetical protein